MPPSAPSPFRRLLPLWLAVLAARSSRLVLRLFGRGGTTLPGKIVLALRPDAIARMRLRMRNSRVVVVSATNGKTTTAAMLATMLRTAGEHPVHNVSGANLRSGVATTLVFAPRKARTVLLEIDEAALPTLVPDLRPDVIVLSNLFRDQLDRYGELDVIAERWGTMLATTPGDPDQWLVFNADDPLIAQLALSTADEDPRIRLGFGLDDSDVTLPTLAHAADSKFCRRCGALLTYERTWLGHLGDYRCTACGFERPEPQVRAVSVTLEGLGATHFDVVRTLDDDARSTPFTGRIRIPGLYNAYNAMSAAAAATALALPTEAIVEGLAAFSPAFGRFERIPLPGGGSLTLLLVKNPTGLNEVIRTLVDADVDLTATLFALNDGIADGRDTSWIWDADVEPLVEHAPSLIVTGDRAAEFALRCVYAGCPREQLTIDTDLDNALGLLLHQAEDFTAHRHAYALVTYTAMLELRGIIRMRGWVNAFWDEHRERTVPA